MAGSCIDVGRLSRFVHRSANAELAVLVRQHVQCCTNCRERLTLMQGFADNLFDDMQPLQGGTCNLLKRVWLLVLR